MIHNIFINNKILLGNIVKRPYPVKIESRVKKMFKKTIKYLFDLGPYWPI